MSGSEDRRTRSGRASKEMLLFFSFVSIFLILVFGGIGMVLSIVYTQDSTIDWIYPASSVGFAFFLIIGQFVTHVNHSRPMFLLYLLSSLGLAVFFYLFLISFILLLLILILFFLEIAFNEFFLADLIRISIPLVVLLLITYGAVNARYLRKRWVEVPVLKGHGRIRVALISDLHLGLLVGSKRLNSILRYLHKERPDIIISAGDLLDTNPGYLKRFEPFLNEMCEIAPVYAVIGNHEYYNGMSEAIDWLSSLGVEVLDNRCKVDRKTELSLIGVNDPSAFGGGRDYLNELIRLMNVCGGSKARILVNHQPLYFSKAAKSGIDLQLSGHTHAGQIWPFGYTTRAIFKEGDRGLQRIGDSFMYVCTGTGTWGPPLRIGTSSEMVIVELIEKE